MGTVFRPKYSPKGMTYAQAKEGGLLVESPSWWIKWRDHTGRPVKEKVGPSEKDARRRLKLREGAVAEGKPVAIKAERVLIGELADDLTNEYRANGRRSAERLKFSLARLLPFFGHRRAMAVTKADVEAYKAKRQSEKAANATINRELAALKRMYRLALDEKIHRAPKIELLREDNVRQGFFEREQMEAVRRHLRSHLRPLVTVAYITGWRAQSELLPLNWKQVDFSASTLRLEPGETKNRDGRMFIMTPELRACLEQQRTYVEGLQRALGRIIPHVFVKPNGEPIKGFRRAWANACFRAGLGTKMETPQLNGKRKVNIKAHRIPHDFRRTAVRNLERAGVPRSVAMRMVGHRTEAMYRRYAIVSESDMRAAAERLGALHAAGH